MNIHCLNSKPVNSIIVLNFITTTIGDALYVLPVVQKLRKEFSSAKIFLTGSSITRDLIGGDPVIDEFLLLNGLEFVGHNISWFDKSVILFKIFFRTLFFLWSKRPDVCIVLLPNFSLYHLVALLSGARIRLGFSYPGSWLSWTLTRSVFFRNPETTRDVNVHLSEANLDVLKPLGIKISRSDMILRRYTSDDEISDGLLALKHAGVKGKFVVFQIGARIVYRQWPIDRFAFVAKSLVSRCGVSIVLVGSSSEFDICENVKNLVGDKCYNIAGKASLGAIAGLMSRSELVIGNDSGLMHLAASVGAQTVGLFGSPNPAHSAPLGVKKPIIILPKSWHSYALFEKAPSDKVSKYLLDITAKTVANKCVAYLKIKK